MASSWPWASSLTSQNLSSKWGQKWLHPRAADRMRWDNTCKVLTVWKPHTGITVAADFNKAFMLKLRSDTVFKELDLVTPRFSTQSFLFLGVGWETENHMARVKARHKGLKKKIPFLKIVSFLVCFFNYTFPLAKTLK